MTTPVAYRAGQEIPGTNYRVQRVLGEGGHAFVYLGQHTVLTDRRAAIKVLHDTFSDQPDLARRMRAEANILAQLHHPNLVKVFDAGMTTESPRPYIVMEYLRGEPLSSSIAASPNGFSLAVALQTAVQVLAGLTAAHKLGVVHRDIKPANIFTCRQDDTDVTKLIDFGVASIDAAKRTTGQFFMGTPRYAAPEQIGGQHPTPQTDLYSVGLVLYELVCGRGPFDDIKPTLGVANYAHLMQMHLTRIPPRPSTIRRDIPPELEQLIVQLLEKEPGRRPKTSMLLEAALHDIARRLEAETTATLADLNRTEPTPLANRLIVFSAKTDPLPAPTDPAHDTPLDPYPMGNRRTLRMHPAGPTDPSDLSDLHQGPAPSPGLPAVKRTIRMPTAPPHPTAPSEPTSLASSASSVAISPGRSEITLPRPHSGPRTTQKTIAASSAHRLDAEPSSSRSQQDTPLSASLLPAPVAARHSSPPPPPAVAPQVFVAPQGPPEPSAPPGLVLQAQGLRRVAHSRPWQLGAGATVLLLLLVTLWTTTRQPRFVPPGPPAWLTAQPTPATASSTSTPSDGPDPSAQPAAAATQLPSDRDETLSPQPTAALPSPAPQPPAPPPPPPRLRPVPHPAAPPSEFKTVFH